MSLLGSRRGFRVAAIKADAVPPARSPPMPGRPLVAWALLFAILFFTTEMVGWAANASVPAPSFSWGVIATVLALIARWVVGRGCSGHSASPLNVALALFIVLTWWLEYGAEASGVGAASWVDRSSTGPGSSSPRASPPAVPSSRHRSPSASPETVTTPPERTPPLSNQPCSRAKATVISRHQQRSHYSVGALRSAWDDPGWRTVIIASPLGLPARSADGSHRHSRRDRVCARPPC